VIALFVWKPVPRQSTELVLKKPLSLSMICPEWAGIPKFDMSYQFFAFTRDVRTDKAVEVSQEVRLRSQQIDLEFLVAMLARP
jgi:hypothetical protein